MILLGALIVAAALSPWTDGAADASLRAHMLQHDALLFVAAPLLVLGIPRHGALRGLPRSVARALVALGKPVPALAAFAAVEFGIHFTPFFELAAVHTWAHVLEHLAFLVGGIVFWWAVLGPTASLAARALLLLLAMPLHALVGVVLLLDDHARYAHYPSLAEQHSAASLDWSLGSLLLGAALAVAGWRWISTEERRAAAREAYGR